MTRVRDRVAESPDPLLVLASFLDRHSAHHRVDHRRLNFSTRSVLELDSHRNTVPERVPSRSGKFSLKYGAGNETPACFVMPGGFMSDGIREASAWPRTARPSSGDSRLFSAMGPPATVRTPARTLGSTLRNTVP